MGMADSGSDIDFGFAFNNVSFSDRLLRIEITRGGGDSDSAEVGCPSIVNRKRRREHVKNQIHELDLATFRVESDLNNKSRESNYEDNKKDKHEGEGSEDENECLYLGMTTTNPSLVRVKELHISSLILAAKSPFFFKLLSNGMLESEQKHFTLKIDASEEAAVMELLNFMYTNSLSATEVPALLHVLIAADKFEVASCFKYCSRMLLNVPMTLDSALLILHLPSTLLMADPVKPLTNAARRFLTSRYKNLSKHTEELMALPLVGIEAILESDDLMVVSEDVVYDFVLRWAEKHYSVLEERQEILGSHLARYIRFPHMTCQRLKQILDSDDFKRPIGCILVHRALLFKAESLPHRTALAAKEYASLKALFFKAESLPHRRAYIYRPIKIVEFEVPRRQCIVYLDLTRKECEALNPSSRIPSELFHFGGQSFFLLAKCSKVPENLFQSFGLFLVMQEKGSVSQTVDFEFSARSKPTEDFDVKQKGKYNFDTGYNSIGFKNLFATPWDSFIAKDSPYFINDVLHLRADLSIRL